MVCRGLLFLIALSSSLLLAETPSVEEIMAKVAANQDHAVQQRIHYTYTQEVRVKTLRKNGQLSREENSVYQVLPSATGTKTELVRLSGKYAHKGRLVEYKESHPSSSGVGQAIDEGLIEGLRDGLIHDEDSKDGIAQDLFPLTSQELPKYSFRLKAQETYQGKPAYRVEFFPKKNRDEEDSGAWSGEALIDATDFQPISIWTNLAQKIPFWVRTALGTNIQQLGFSLAYRKFADGVWFPISYGGEFKIRAVFFYARTITLSMKNTDFKRTEADSSIIYDAVR